jgi:hypothetical protein
MLIPDKTDMAPGKYGGHIVIIRSSIDFQVKDIDY